MTVKANHPCQKKVQRKVLSLLYYGFCQPHLRTHHLQKKIPIVVVLLASIFVGILLSPLPTFAKTETDNSEEIIFIDTDGFIRVLDIHQVGDNPLVKWVSPEGGWRHVALGDFNNDTDLEIVAVGGGSKTGKLAIYDPVVATGGAGKPQINDIPWDTLYTTAIAGGKPLLVGAGNLDAGIPGDEIIYINS